MHSHDIVLYKFSILFYSIYKSIKVIENRYLQRIFIKAANFLFVCLFPKRLASARARASSRARHWLIMDGVNDALFNAVPNVQQAMAQNVAVTLNVVSRTQKK